MLFVIFFLVTPCFEVTVQPSMEWTSIKKIALISKQTWNREMPVELALENSIHKQINTSI